MNLGLRAILYTVRKWKKTFLVFCLFCRSAPWYCQGLRLQTHRRNRQRKSGEPPEPASLFRETYPQAAGQAEAAGSYSTQEFMTEDMIREIASVDGHPGI